ncbi:DUF4382 domain-containing protein [Candidatus Nanohalovita haloferacivicina]|uniref:DUF4382 domain-containing protein n=1 Tax=Candidatus Nanohalovita haloferacivicina TaxID=2978046 RepID=UPI00325FB82D|nr:DUF4382 family protein [Candidatus Nanohalobia archaeon BNXNv]
MERIYAIALLAAVIAVSGCTSTTSSDTGQFELLISDQQAAIDDFDYLNVEFSHANIFAVNNSSVNVQQVSLNNTSAVDLTQVRNLTAESLVNTTLPAGNYSKIELYSERINASVDGENVDVKIPPGKLMITKPFEVRPNETTSFVFDIQVVLRGNQQNNQGYILRPVTSESGVAGRDVEVERKRTRDRNRSMNQTEQPPTPNNSSQGQGQ